MTGFFQAVTDAIKTIDPARPEYDAINELVKVLSELGETKASEFQLQIREAVKNAGKGEDIKFPVKYIDKEKTEVHAYAADSAEHIADAVKNGLAGLFKSIKGNEWEEIANASVGLAADAIKTGITAFIGKASASSASNITSEVIVDGITLARLDYKIWSREINTQGIKATCQKIVAVSYTKSWVDMEKLDRSAFYAKFEDLVTKTYKLTDPLKVMNKCDALYNRFHKQHQLLMSSI